MLRVALKFVLRSLNKVRLVLLTYSYPRPNSGAGRIVCGSYGTRLRLSRARGSSLIMHGDLRLQSDLGHRGDVIISLGSNSTLEIHGDFTVGSGVRISVESNARLVIGGRKNSAGSGITNNTRVMVNREMSIGADTIIAWDCFVTDCDWHQIEGRPNTKCVILGERVWIAQGVTILKGTEIGNGSIVGSGSVVTGGTFPNHSLIAGNPAKVLREGISWHRDMDPNFYNGIEAMLY